MSDHNMSTAEAQLRGILEDRAMTDKTPATEAHDLHPGVPCRVPGCPGPGRTDKTPATEALYAELAEIPLSGARYALHVVKERMPAIEAEACAPLVRSMQSDWRYDTFPWNGGVRPVGPEADAAIATLVRLMSDD